VVDPTTRNPPLNLTLSHPKVYRYRFRFRLAVGFVVVRFAVPRAFGLVRVRLATRSGRRLPPVSRFHSSYVAGEIFPSTNNCANLRRWAALLNGTT
jgi:hypothetical protein